MEYQITQPSRLAMSERFLERDIKLATIKYLIETKKIALNDILINEFTVDNHTRRVDLLVIKNNLSIAYEIKSEADSLLRINGQLEKYKSYFDKVVVISATKHISKLKKTISADYGLWHFDEKQKIKIITKGKIKRINDKCTLLKLFPITALHKMANEKSIIPKDKNRINLETALKKQSISEIRSKALIYLTTRYKKYSENFMHEFSKNNTSPSTIDSLSPYASSRLIRKNNRLKKIESLKKLTSQHNDDYGLVLAAQQSSTNIFGDIPPEIIIKYLKKN